jgi:hypothetical protein
MKETKDWFSFRAPPTLARELRDEAKSRGATLTAVIVERLEGVVGSDNQVRSAKPNSPSTVDGDGVAQTRASRVVGEDRPSVDPAAIPAEVADNAPVTTSELPPGPIKAITEDSITFQRSPATNSCTHPIGRQRVVTKGRKCLDCGALRRVNSSKWELPGEVT